ncbi:MAG: DEAD/DEAH box helicase [Planctomycetes bacterium]|nr:DEAD/DEAH box helicase [Planctomycetota bacterium]
MKFSEIDLPENILEKLHEMGFEEMTPIQEKTYPIISSGKDLCAIAETGSGKTAACAIPLIQKVDTSHNVIQGLVVVPTRELCMQYVGEIQKIAANTAVTPFAVFGGFDKEIEIAKLKHGVHILVATPGRLIDFLYSGKVSLSNVKCAILDEADELLKVGFLEDIEFILSCILHEHQTLLFSATMPEDIKKLAHDCFRNPQHISLISKRAAPESIEHYFFYLHPKNKQVELLKYVEGEKVEQMIIFCNARHKVDSLFRTLRQDFKDTEYIHAGLNQGKRTSIFMRFRNRKIRYLIASDVAGRGLDFSHVSHVVNWDFPEGRDRYTHRTGRAGRMGRKGKAFTFVTRHDLTSLREIIDRKTLTPTWIGKDPFLESRSHRDGETRKKKRRFRPYSKKAKKRAE